MRHSLGQCGRRLASCGARRPEIAAASGLKLEALKAPQKRLRTAAGEAEILPASDSAGAASSSYDLAIIDELGLLAEKHREFVASMRSSVSAKGGRFLALTIHGIGTVRAGNPSAFAWVRVACLIHHYHAPFWLRGSMTGPHGARQTLASAQSRAWLTWRAKRRAQRLQRRADQASFPRARSQYAPGEAGRANDCHASTNGSAVRRCSSNRRAGAIAQSELTWAAVLRA